MSIIESDTEQGVYSLAQLFSIMDYAVIEVTSANSFHLSAEPVWFDPLVTSNENQVLTDRFPFLESFLPEAFLFWEKLQDGRIQSDFWTQTNIAGEEIHLLAYAVSLNWRRFLLIRSAEDLYKERQTWQMYAHETAIQLRTIARLQRAMEETTHALKIANVKLNELSIQDSLTGVYNRRHFEHTFDLELRRTYRSGEPISILFMDVDHFKLLNDTFGHSAGDECLRSIGKLLKDFLRRPGDLVARIGGEEFAVVLPGIAGSAALQLAQSINQKIRNLKISNTNSDADIRTTVSLGVYTRPPKGEETMSQILQIVDGALYQAKRSGRDKVVVASSTSKNPHCLHVVKAGRKY
ncbi:GGDEF domain-containing protein [Edaphobacter dinghuensis]|uniref:diguanylate cyclase n=1 Tax=Edaphobacter dinghuensis TaxID=1560005 RepID=A0A917HCG9_9BACT|nr:GGDEF domain-containing protein [Edaphobacter dinghuensis]GGG74909.1 hypothetical protein GCM10011585_17080 [Edaphobacter dinghuensis]